MNIGPLLVQTVRHFFPDLNVWLDEIADPRFEPMIIYHKRFLLWWGLSLFLFELSSRRQLDYQLDTDGPEVLNNLNRLAGTKQTTRPVNQTLDYFLGRTGSPAIGRLRTQLVQRLIRMKALESSRLQGRMVIAFDATGYLVFDQPHCEYCLTQQHGEQTSYMHQALEAKLLGPADTVFSIGTEFIDNRDRQGTPADASSEKIKQDCELRAMGRLVPAVRAEFPQLRLCFSGDGLYACGEGFQLAKDARASFVYTFKQGRMPTLWQEFQTLLSLCEDQRVEVQTPQGVHQVYRWVKDLSYTDSKKRTWTLTAIQCQERLATGEKRLWAWVVSPDLDVDRTTVQEVSQKGGRNRWHEENQGFNTQKNSGLNLEHAYSHTHWAAYYYLLQIAHLMLQLLHKGSLLRHLAKSEGRRTAVELFGSLKNMAQRLLESVRYRRWPANVFKRGQRIQIRLDSG